MTQSERNGRRRSVFAEPSDEPAVGSMPTGAADDLGSDVPLQPRVIERAAIIRLSDMTTILEEDDARRVKEFLAGLVRDHGHSRLLINFNDVRYASRVLLVGLARLEEEVKQQGGWIRVCGLNPLTGDLLRSLGLERTLDACSDEAQALGLLIR